VSLAYLALNEPPLLTVYCCSRSPIDVFVTYDGKRAADIAVSRYAVRHLVAAEVRDLIEDERTPS